MERPIVPENPFASPGRWFRGNLHTHSLESDGELPPSSVARWYQRRGYDFISLTDHRVVVPVAELSRDDFLVIPGIELDTPYEPDGSTFHVVGLGVTGPGRKVPRSAMTTPQQALDTINEMGGRAFIAHPKWSGNDVSTYRELTGYFGLEIFTYSAEIENHTGEATPWWDGLLRKGIPAWGVATDDAHWNRDDACGGWVMVKANELSAESILAALVSGRFYSSAGPRIDDVSVQGDRIRVRTSPVQAIHFMSHGPRGHSFFAPKGEQLTHAEWTVDTRARYVRIECIDAFGRPAWTQPVYRTESPQD